MPNITTRADLLDPQVLAPMVQNSYQQAMVFMPLADVDRTLVGKPGDTITVDTWGDIGEATEVAEGADIPVDKLGQGHATAKVIKLAKGVGFTDEASITAFGNVATQATLQIGQKIAQAGDSQLMNLALKSKNTLTTTADVDGIDAMESFFDTDIKNPAYTLICSPKTKLQIDKAVREYTKGSDTGAQIALTGAVPTALGASILPTKKMEDGKIVVVFSSDEDIAKSKELADKMAAGTLTDQEISDLNSGRAFKWYIKRDLLIESEHKPGNQTNYIYGSQIAAPFIQNPAKVLCVTVSGGTASSASTK